MPKLVARLRIPAAVRFSRAAIAAEFSPDAARARNRSSSLEVQVERLPIISLPSARARPSAEQYANSSEHKANHNQREPRALETISRFIPFGHLCDHFGVRIRHQLFVGEAAFVQKACSDRAGHGGKYAYYLW